MSDPEVIPVVERAEVVEPADTSADGERRREEFIEQPAKVMRVGTMLKQLLDEVRSATLDEASRDRLRDIYETSVRELGSALSPDLRDELGRLALPFAEDESTPPSAAEIQIAQAQLVGWLEGLIQGIQPRCSRSRCKRSSSSPTCAASSRQVPAPAAPVRGATA
jgi:hypothetical protein